jgi:hypothetical protein
LRPRLKHADDALEKTLDKSEPEPLAIDPHRESTQ